MGFQEQGELSLLIEAQQQGFPPLPAPDAAVPQEQPLGPLQGILIRCGAGGGRVWAGTWGLVSPHLSPGEEVPKLHPQAR